ncbi:dihydrolipoamide acetyltransferase family protein [Alkalihalobacterium elongatum]|uniref:dihydrolipoamide acetyltransferase family protein n=1 Tax=Alkalihalobacterium elongatum TaxID=2675466 RepID=UPI001C1F7D61|nr:dihydrolipoamide acetyltransferase family protein [Alkalihalobacterium elongatum]
MIEVKMPRLGVTMQNGTISSWLVEEGEEVNKGDFLFELETEKSTLEIEAQASGILRKILVPEDQEVPINTVIAVMTETIDEELDLSIYEETSNNQSGNEKISSQQQASVNTSTLNNQTNRGKISPRARKLAKELGVAIETVIGTGKGGIITEDDIRNAQSPHSAIAIKEKIALNHVKKAMADNMLKSWTTTPQFTQMVSVNMENVLKIKKEFGNVSLNDIIVKVVGNTAQAHPLVNSKLDGNEIVVYEEVNVSVAVNSQHGLVVPVVKNTERKSVFDISKEIQQLAGKAENNQLTLEDYANGTITVSNLGSLGIETGTPIINVPQSTIIFVGTIVKKPIVNEEEEIVVAPIMTLSICYDHRFIDGVTGAKFTNEIKKALENIESNDLN